MPRWVVTLSCLPALLLAIIVSVDISSEASEMLLRRSGGNKEVWITDIFYA